MKKLKWWQLTGIIIDLIGAVFITLCIATDINDGLFLPLALTCVLIANAFQLVMDLHDKRKKQGGK